MRTAIHCVSIKSPRSPPLAGLHQAVLHVWQAEAPALCQHGVEEAAQVARLQHQHAVVRTGQGHRQQVLQHLEHRLAHHGAVPPSAAGQRGSGSGASVAWMQAGGMRGHEVAVLITVPGTMPGSKPLALTGEAQQRPAGPTPTQPPWALEHLRLPRPVIRSTLLRCAAMPPCSAWCTASRRRSTSSTTSCGRAEQRRAACRGAAYETRANTSTESKRWARQHKLPTPSRCTRACRSATPPRPAPPARSRG